MKNDPDRNRYAQLRYRNVARKATFYDLVVQSTALTNQESQTQIESPHIAREISW